MQCLFSQSDLPVSLHILKHLATCRPLLLLKQNCTAAADWNLSAARFHLQLPSININVSFMVRTTLSHHNAPISTLFRYKTIQQQFSRNVSASAFLLYKFLMSPNEVAKPQQFKSISFALKHLVFAMLQVSHCETTRPQKRMTRIYG